MLAYAAPRPGREAAHPKTLLLIVAGHAVVIAAVMLAKSDLPARFVDKPILIEPIKLPPDPPPLPVQAHHADPKPTIFVAPKPLIDVAPRPVDQPVVETSATISLSNGSGEATGPVLPVIDPVTVPHDIVRHGPQLATRGDAIRPPYPDVKRMLGQEASLTLKLSIDSTGRVTAVEPIGAADPVFLDSARRHLMRVWRFAPATEDGRAVPATKVITLRFELGDA